MEINPNQLETLRRNNQLSNEYTREAIRQALVLLMKSQSYADIKMSDIIRKSGVSRSGLYANYKTKEEIVFDIAQVFINEITQEMSAYLTDVERLFRYVRKNRAMIGIIKDAGLIYKILEHMNSGINKNKLRGIQDAMWNGIIFNVLLVWIDNGMKESDKEAAELMILAMKSVGEISLYGENSV